MVSGWYREFDNKGLVDGFSVLCASSISDIGTFGRWFFTLPVTLLRKQFSDIRVPASYEIILYVVLAKNPLLVEKPIDLILLSQTQYVANARCL